MTKINQLLLIISLISISILMGACNKDDDDDNNKDPLTCDRTISGSATLGQESFNVSMKVAGSGTYSVSKIEYLDENGNLQTLNNPDLPWEETIVLTGTSGTTKNYKLSMYTSITNGKVTATLIGEDSNQYISSSRECSQYSE